jgi:hypothetical protein
MATIQRQTPGISSRRSACDKCRFSKARCQRKHRDQMRCDRCSRTHSECVTSPVFRLRSWRPPSTHDNVFSAQIREENLIMKRQQRSIQQPLQHALAASDPNLDMDIDLGLLKSDQGQHLGPGEQSNPGTSCLKPSSPHHAPPLLYGEDLEEQIDAFDFLDDSLDMTLPEALFTPIAQPSPRPDHTPSSSSFQPSNSESTYDAGGTFGQPRTLDESILVNNLQISTTPKQTPLQTISRLDYELVITLAHLEREPSEGLTKTLFDNNGDLSFALTMDRTLTGTTDFVNALKLLVGPQPSMSPKSLNSRGDGLKYGSQRARRNSLSSIESEYDSSDDSDAHDIDLPHGPRTASCDQTSCQELDTPSLLSILVVYIRFLRLYLAIFQQIYEHLKELSERGSLQIQPMSVPSISNLPIRKSLRFRLSDDQST